MTKTEKRKGIWKNSGADDTRTPAEKEIRGRTA